MRRLILAALSARGLFLIYALLGSPLFKLNRGYLGIENFPDLSPLLSSWANFDGRHFIKIATDGYSRFNFVYFPLYPLAITTIKKLVNLHPIVIGIFLSLTAYLLAVTILKKLLLLETSVASFKSFFLLFFLFPFIIKPFTRKLFFFFGQF